MKSITTYMVVLAILVVFVAGCTTQNPAIAPSPPPTTDTANLRVAEIGLPGMFCKSCAQSSENVFKGMPGVVDAKVDIGEEIGMVIYDSSITSKEQLVQDGLIQAYDGKILNDQKYSQE